MNTKKQKRQSLRDSLLDQLRAKGADIRLYRSLIDDYCFYDRQLKAMKRSIRDKGRTYSAVSAAGKEYEKDNPDVKNAALYSKLMLSILQQMDLTTDNVVNPDDMEDDL